MIWLHDRLGRPRLGLLSNKLHSHKVEHSKLITWWHWMLLRGFCFGASCRKIVFFRTGWRRRRHRPNRTRIIWWLDFLLWIVIGSWFCCRWGLGLKRIGWLLRWLRCRSCRSFGLRCRFVSRRHGSFQLPGRLHLRRLLRLLSGGILNGTRLIMRRGMNHRQLSTCLTLLHCACLFGWLG